MVRLTSVDLLLYWGLIGTIGVAHSLLLTTGTPWESTTWFYIIMWAASMLIIILCWTRYKELGQFDYDEPLTREKLYYVVGGFASCFIISSLLVSAYTRSSIWVPQPHLSLSVGGMGLTAVINDIFYQLALVSNSEETMVLGMSQIIRRKLHESLSSKYTYLIPGLALGLPRAGWAILHAYQSYVGSLMPILVASAFISGMVISYCAYNNKVKSFLVAMLIHFAYNAFVIIVTSGVI